MVASTEPPRALLERLLGSLFGSDGLHRYLLLGPEGEAVKADLPETQSTPRQLVHAAVDVLARRGLIDVAFFDRLCREFPRRSADIRSVCGVWIGARPEGVYCPPLALVDSELRSLADRLEEAYLQREELIVAGSDSSAIDRLILELRREQRRGPQLQPGEALLSGRYRLVEPIGSGGFATVWRAYDRELRLLVAVKVLHGQWSRDSGHSERFARGARGMSRLRHPAIVRVLREPVEENGFHFYVMEMLDGGTLRQAILDRALNLPRAITVLLTICDALDYAHAQSVVHRDVKPGNILLDRQCRAYLSDFDLMRAEHTTGGTRTGAGIGSLFFAAPEALADAREVDPRADVYSVGMTLLFVALGRELTIDDFFDAQSSALAAHPVLRPILRRALMRQPDSRFSSIIELQRALREAEVLLERSTSAPLGTAEQSAVGRPREVSQRHLRVVWLNDVTSDPIVRTYDCSRYQFAKHLIDEIFEDFPEGLAPPMYTYGRVWVLRRRETGEVIRYDRNVPVLLESLGFVPGSEFEVVMLAPVPGERRSLAEWDIE